MKMIGHKTERIYRRYAIADERSIKEAATKLDQFYALDQRADGNPKVNSFLEVHTACGYKSAAHLNQVITDGSYVRTLQRISKVVAK